MFCGNPDSIFGRSIFKCFFHQDKKLNEVIILMVGLRLGKSVLALKSSKENQQI